jgi:hypothetical protein
MARPQLVDGAEGLRIWNVPANISNKKLRTVDKRWSSNLELGEGLTTPHRKNVASFKTVYIVSDLGSSFETSNGKSTWDLECGMLRAFMNSNPEVRSATSGSGFATVGPGSLKQLQENLGNRPIPYFRISGRARYQMRRGRHRMNKGV